MANYEAAARTNYFRVKDIEAFRAACRTVPGIELWEQAVSAFPAGTQRNGLVALGAEDGWPSDRYAPDDDDPRGPAMIEFDIVDFVMEHLAEGSVAVIAEVGHEKLRYLDGWATAINSKGELRRVSLMTDIMELARTLGEEVTDAAY